MGRVPLRLILACSFPWPFLTLCLTFHVSFLAHRSICLVPVELPCIRTRVWSWSLGFKCQHLCLTLEGLWASLLIPPGVLIFKMNIMIAPVLGLVFGPDLYAPVVILHVHISDMVSWWAECTSLTLDLGLGHWTF